MHLPRPAFFAVGEGPLVMLLHCSMGSKNQWKELADTLAPRYRCVAPDLYGYGETPMPAAPESYTLRDEVDLVLALADEVAPGEPLHLVGHSYGGAVALALCHSHPERVSSLTVFEPVAFHLLEQGDPALEQVAAMRVSLAQRLRAGERLEAARTFIDYWSGAGTFDGYPQRVQNDLARRTEKLILEFRALTQSAPALSDYKKITAPVTVIAGTASKPPALRVAELLSTTVPSCALRWVDTGHMGPVTDPRLVNPVIAAALDN